ncbi:MAG: molybdenum cofactor guanylyltransferase [Verrucomicrobia bacterium]|nr:molybdenum cofactor guanylyltransferase [Verrucomicrobiota bacterium]
MNKREIAFTGVVLAGGRSTRMGRDKALLTLEDGRTLLERAVAVLREFDATEILVSTGSDKTYGMPGTRELADVRADCGPLGGLHACLSVAKEQLCLVLAVDLPAMAPSYLRGLLSRTQARRGVVPVIDGSAEPLVAVYSKEALAEVQRALETGDYSLQKLIRRLEQAGLVDLVPVEPGERPLFANWNSPEDCR